MIEEEGSFRRGFSRVPTWVKFASFLVSGFSLLTALALVARLIGSNENDSVILVAMSVVQISLSAIIILMIYFFTERRISIDTIIRETETFLTKEVREAIEGIQFTEPYDAKKSLIGRKIEKPHVNVRVMHHEGAISARFFLDDVFHDQSTSFWVRVNVKEIVVVLYVPTFDQPEAVGALDAETVRARFQPTIETFEQRGFRVSVKASPEAFDQGRVYYNITLIKSDEFDLFFDGALRAFTVLNIAHVVRNFLIDASQSGLVFGPKKR